MAIKLEIDNGDACGRVDYTRYVASAESAPIILRDRMNQPALLDFTLQPADAAFVIPRRSAYVRLTGLADALPPGGPRLPGPLFTGYLTNEPAIEFLGWRNGAPVHGYRLQATSEEYLLNVKRIGVVPAFLNQTAGAVLRALANLLQPGRFDLSGVADGAFLPHFRPDAEAKWGDIARELAERSGCAYRVLDAKIIFQPVSAIAAGLAVDEADKRFRPDALEISPAGNTIQNDVTVFGAVEPQAHVAEYFAGDGFTSRFPLSFPVYGAESARLLADDFTAAAIDAQRWIETDPLGKISQFEGRLNVTGGSSALGAITLLAQQAIELGGEVELLHGEYEFVAPSTGLIGGLYSAAGLALGDCLAAFDVTPVSGQTRIRALVNGSFAAAETVTQAGRHYIFVTRLSANVAHRTQQTFPALEASFGGASVPATIRVTLEVRELDVASPANVTTITLYSGAVTNWPAFAFYAPINSADLHVAMNFLQVTRPIQASLESTLPGGTPRQRRLGVGIAGQDATITSDATTNQWALEFYENSVPARGETLSLRYRAAGRAAARVRDASRIATEASLAGDDGVRAAVLNDVQPPPRTSVECELAAQAWLADHAAPQYEGRYVTWGELADGFPRAGARLEIRCASRYPVFRAQVRSVTSEIRELFTERILHTVEFGRPSNFEQLLQKFVPGENVLAPAEDVRIAPADVTALATQFVADLSAPRLASLTPALFELDMGAAPAAGVAYEVRRSDAGWSSAGIPGSAQNRIGTYLAQSIFLPRSGRNHVYSMRPVNAAGVTSRYSAAIAVHYPLLPPPVASLTLAHERDERGAPILRAGVGIPAQGIQDVDRVELRDSDNATALVAWTFGQLREEGGLLRAEIALDNSVALVRDKTVFAYTQNVLGEYSAQRSASAAKAAPLKPSLSPGNSVGQILEILLTRTFEDVIETQIQVAGPGASFLAPSQDSILPGQPGKFSFVATQSGNWEFRGRRRDGLGWSPWSNEPQGQIPAESLVYVVRFLEAPSLDPSIGAAINSQNLLPNSEFFLPGVAGQEGTHAPRYFGLVNAAAGGSEVDYAASANEIFWRAGVNFAAANPGFRSLLSNLGRVFNPGEPLTVSAALRHTGTGFFSRAVRVALRSPGSPSYDITRDISANSVGATYQWFSVTFALPTGQAVPSDLSIELSVVISAGQSLASELRCDKLLLNRGHRPAAFSLALWDVLALAWNAGAYDLPATAVAAAPRTSDSGGAGLLAGTGTEDLDPDFTARFLRLTA